MKIMAAMIIMGVSSFLLLTTAAGDVTFSDDTFNDADWTLIPIQIGPGGSTFAERQLSGGNPGSFREITNILNATHSTEGSIYGIHLRNNAQYTPATEGAIATLDYAEDSIEISDTNGEATGPALQQGGTNYVYITQLSSGFTSWTHQSLTGLMATNFGQLTTNGVLNTINPDFSRIGPTITFGFLRRNSTRGAPYTRVGGIDNWTNTIHSTTPLITQAGYSKNVFSLSFPSLASSVYVIQYKNSLADPSWLPVQTLVGTGNTLTVQDAPAPQQSRFYRIANQGLLTGPLTPLEPPQAPPASPASASTPTAIDTLVIASPQALPASSASASSYGASAENDTLPYLFTGESQYSTKDPVIKGRGMDFVWGLMYRSMNGPNTVAGNRWDFSYDIYVQQTNTGFTVFNGNAYNDTYALQSDGTYGADQLFNLGTFSNNVFTLEFPDTGTWQFRPFDGSASQGKIEYITDRNGNYFSFAYDGFGRLTNVIDTLGRTNQISYNSDGFISALTDFAGRTTTYAYYQTGDAGGSFGDLKSVTRPAVTGTPNDNDFPLGKTFTFTYTTGYANDLLNHHLLTVTDAKGQTWLSNTYASTTNAADFNFGRLLSQQRGYSNEVFTFFYEPQTPEPSTQFGVTKATVNDPMGNVSEYLFDYLNRLVRLRQFTGRATPGVQTTDTQNLPTGQLRASDPAYFETDYQWNADSMLTQIVYPNGNSVSNVYELALNPAASRRSRGNLRVRTMSPGPLGGDQAVITQTYVYDTTFGCSCGFNFVTQATDGRGNTTYNFYNAHGNLTNTIPPIASAAKSYAYNQYGQITAFVLPDNGSGYHRTDIMSYYTNGPQAGFLQQYTRDANGFALTTSYGYDAVGNVIKFTDPRGNVASNVVNQLNQVVRQISRPVNTANGQVSYQRDMYYDLNNNLVQVNFQNINDQGILQSSPYITNTIAYDILNCPVSMTQEVNPTHNVVTAFAYDANHNLILTSYGQATSGADPFNTVTSRYDERNLLYQKARAQGSPIQSTTQYDYDGNGNLVETIHGIEDTAAPHVVYFTWDGYNRCMSMTDPMGNVTTNHYDADGNTGSTLVTGGLIDLPGGANNVPLAQTTFTYDTLNRKVQTDQAFFDTATGTNIGSGHAISQIVYNGNSQVIQTINADNQATTTAYDTANRPLLITDANSNTLAYVYDANGNPVTVTKTDRSDSGGPSQVFVTQRAFDGLNRLVQTTDNLGHVTLRGYDSLNDLTHLTDARGNETLYIYDGLRRQVQQVRQMTTTGDGKGTVTNTITTLQSWDDSSRLISRTDNNNNTTTWLYDSLNRPAGRVFADGTTNSTTYNVHNNPVTFVDANGTVVTSAFDLCSRVLTNFISRAPGVVGPTLRTFSYDGRSRLVSASDDNSAVTRSYDSLSHVTTETQQVLPGGPVNTVTRVYDALGNVIQINYPGGRSISRSYNALNQPVLIQQLLPGPAYDIASYQYIGRRVQTRNYPNGVLLQISYDGVGRPTNTLDTTFGGSVTNDNRFYAWDAANNEVSVSVPSSALPESKTLNYDSADRLILSATASGPTIGYALDGDGNRQTVSGGPDAGSYSMSATLPEPADSQVNQYTTTPFDERTYDRKGNLLTSGAGVFSYDFLNRLTQFIQPGVTTNFYAYDYQGRRLAKNENGCVTIYCYSGWQDIEDQSSTGVTLATYVWSDLSGEVLVPPPRPRPHPQPQPRPRLAAYVLGQCSDELLEMTRSNQFYYFESDNKGSVTRVTDASGNLVEEYAYADYGEPSFFNGGGAALPGTQIGNDTLFTRQHYDPETGLYYYGTRYFDPRAGRFISRDSIGIWGDRANAGNGYTYVGNNPYTFVDPLGMTNKVIQAITDFVQDQVQGLCTDAALKYFRLGWLIPVADIAGYVVFSPTELGTGDTPSSYNFILISQPYELPEVEINGNDNDNGDNNGGDNGSGDNNGGDNGSGDNGSGGSGGSGGGDSGGCDSGGGGGGGDDCGGGGGCFVADTPVKTTDGIKAIQDIKIGDYVLSYNESTNLVEARRVTKLIRASRKDLVQLKIGTTLITCSRNHRFYTSEGKWVAAEDLSAQERVMVLQPGAGALRESNFEVVNAPQREAVCVYNFKVEHNHNYFVGLAAVLCHNTKADNDNDGLGDYDSDPFDDPFNPLGDVPSDNPGQ